MRKSLNRTVIGLALAATVLASASPATVLAAPPAMVAAQGVELTVTAEQANVRSGPSTADTIIGVVTKGTKLVADAKTADNAWFRVNYQGKQAFIFAQLVSTGGVAAAAPAAPPAPPAAPAPATSGVNVTVTSAALNVRSQPSLNASIIGQLTKGQTVPADAKTADGQWIRINYQGKQAFVWATFTSFAAGSAPAAAAAAPAAAAAAPGSFTGFDFGAHFKETSILGRMRSDAGMGWAKYQVVMPGGAPDLSGVIAAAKGAGLKILIGAVGDRGRAADANYHKEFAAALATVARQGPDAIEVWNEPNLDREYGGSNTGQVNPENYVNMLKEAYTAIKAANANVIVVSGATAPTGYFGGNCANTGCDDAVFVQRMAAAGAANFMDCVGAHHNGTMVGPDQTNNAPVGSAGHHQWYFQGTLDVNFNAFGGKKPVCWTELGYVTKDGIAGSLPGGFSWGNNITMQNQVDWLRRAVELSRASGKVRILIIWNADFRQFDDDPQAGFSIFRPDGSCPACAGLKSVSGR
jgi:uncharacterized protein YraI